MDNQPNIQLTVPFFGVKDMQASLAFYVDGLGYTIANKWEPRGTIEWCWLMREKSSLMLQVTTRFGDDVQKGHGVSICFICADALALYHEFAAKGVAAEEPFVGNNMWVVKVVDPDGYNLFFESDTDVPEETTYTQWKGNNKNII